MDPMHIVWLLVAAVIGFILGWLFKPSKKQEGDLSKEGEGALRAEADSLRARVQDLQGRVASSDTEMSDLKTQLAAAEAASETSVSAAADASDDGADVTAKVSDDDETYALEWQNRYLAARVKYLESRIADGGDAAPAKKGAAKKASAKTKTAKAAPAKKAAVKKSTTSKATATASAKTKADKKPAAKKAAPKSAAPKSAAPKKTAAKSTAANISAGTSGAAKKAKPTAAKKSPAKKAAKAKSNPKIDRAFEQLKKFDEKASRPVFNEIYKYCGIAMTTRDGSLVACKDETEVQQIANGFATKKLGLEKGQLELVQGVCEQMKSLRLKNRAVFYYLAAKKARKLSIFR